MSLTLHNLKKIFGKKTAITQQFISLLYDVLSEDCLSFQQWQRTADTSQKLKTEKIAQSYKIENHDPISLIFVMQTYYALLCKLLAANCLSMPSSIQVVEDGSHFTKHGIQNFTQSDVYSWYVNRLDVTALNQIASQIDYTTPPPDALKILYHDLFPSNLRHALGEYYTPDWFANFVLKRLHINPHDTILDPTCGSGTFIILAYRHLRAIGISNPINQVAGIDVNPLACLSAKANLVLNLDTQDDDITLPIYCDDVLLKPPKLGEFDFIVGNPPWVNWETLPQAYRQATKHLWQKYQLFSHTGFETILGKSKKDLSLLLTYAVVDNYLKPLGQLAFIMTQSVLKTGGAAEAFRRFDFPKKQLKPHHVDDVSKLRIFSGAETKPIVLYMKNSTQQPISYFLWQAPKKRIPNTAELSITESFSHSNFVAEPISGIGSAWMTGKTQALKSIRKIVGQSDYKAHAGVYSGGANAVYWLEVLDEKDEMLLVRNIVDGAKRTVSQVEMWIEKEFVYPLLRGRDLQRWQAQPTAHILVVQNPETRQGYNINWLRQNFPATYDYLAQFEATLRQRATYKRYFKENIPFYTMFDVGIYTFCPYKVVWHGFGKRRMAAAVIGSVDNKAIMTNQAMHPFIGLHDVNEAHFLAACLNSAPFEFALLSHTQSGGKSFAQPGILNTLRLPNYNAENPIHQALSQYSMQAHTGKVDDERIAQLSAKLWGLSSTELRELQDSLQALLN